MNQHYFSESPDVDFRPREIEVELAGAALRVLTAGGVFSPEHLDRGTEVLLRTLDRGDSHPDVEAVAPGAPRILDLGCGWGPIALHAALTHPEAEVWAVDVNARARDLTTENARRLGLPNVRAAAPEGVPGDLRFSEIRSNPPIRVGKTVLHEMLREWLPRLVPGGTAHLVVAKHLGADSLQRWIAEQFERLDVSRAARDKGFHVIRVTG